MVWTKRHSEAAEAVLKVETNLQHLQHGSSSEFKELEKDLRELDKEQVQHMQHLEYLIQNLSSSRLEDAAQQESRVDYLASEIKVLKDASLPEAIQGVGEKFDSRLHRFREGFASELTAVDNRLSADQKEALQALESRLDHKQELLLSQRYDDLHGKLKDLEVHTQHSLQATADSHAGGANEMERQLSAKTDVLAESLTFKIQELWQNAGMMKNVCSELRALLEQVRTGLEQVKKKAALGASKTSALEARMATEEEKSKTAITRMEQSLADLRAQIDSQGATTKEREDVLAMTLKHMETGLRTEFEESLESLVAQITQQATAHSEAWQRSEATSRSNQESTEVQIEDLRGALRRSQTSIDTGLQECERLLRVELSEQMTNNLQSLRSDFERSIEESTRRIRAIRHDFRSLSDAHRVLENSHRTQQEAHHNLVQVVDEAAKATTVEQLSNRAETLMRDFEVLRGGDVARLTEKMTTLSQSLTERPVRTELEDVLEKVDKKLEKQDSRSERQLSLAQEAAGERFEGLSREVFSLFQALEARTGPLQEKIVEVTHQCAQVPKLIEDRLQEQHNSVQVSAMNDSLQSVLLKVGTRLAKVEKNPPGWRWDGNAWKFMGCKGFNEYLPHGKPGKKKSQEAVSGEASTRETILCTPADL